ncbi:MAG: ice-binding family protein [Candidatus Latescibacterota bacterium]
MKTFRTNKTCFQKYACFIGAMLTIALMAPAIVDAVAVAPPLGTINTYAVLSKTTATSTGGGTINGDVGVDGVAGWEPGTPPATVNGMINVNNAATVQAQIDLTAAYNNVDGQIVDATIGTELGGNTLAPGVYDSAAGTFIITGDLTLNGNANDVWIFKTASSLTTAAGAPGAPGSRVILTGGAKANNIYWKVGSSATIGTYSLFSGNVLAEASITMNAGSTMSGSAWARTGAVTFNGSVGFSQAFLASVITSITKNELTPNEFSLSQNYPNPFNPSTTIQYSLVKSGRVTLKIYNVVGQEVATLVNGHQEAGRYTLTLNANVGITSLSSGVYFYRLEAGSFVSMKRLVFMK